MMVAMEPAISLSSAHQRERKYAAPTLAISHRMKITPMVSKPKLAQLVSSIYSLFPTQFDQELSSFSLSYSENVQSGVVL